MVHFQEGYTENVMNVAVGQKVELVGHRIDALGYTKGT
jgi:hypothetical protein